MIVSLSQEVCQQVQDIDRLDRLKNNLSQIQATFDEMIRLKEVAVQLRALVVLQNGRLAEHIIQDIARSMERLVHDVQASAERLESQPRQVKDLTQIREKAQGLINDIKEHWRRYAEDCTRESLELLGLVGHLPEVETQQATYQRLTSRLQHYREHIPCMPTQLAEFDECLRQFNQHLSNIQGLSVQVKNFLEKVSNNQATLDDLTDEVLQWCRQGEHSQAFMISFTRSKRG